MKTVAYLHPTADHCVSVDPKSYANPRRLVLRSEAVDEITRLRAELAECKREKDEALEALSDMVFQFFASASDDMDLLSHSFMSAEEHAISVLIKYGRAKEERRNRYRLIDAAIAGGE